MDPKKPNQKLFDIFVHDFLVKSGFPNTAESFRNEAQIIRVIPPVFSDFEQYPHGTLYGLWSLFLCNSGSTGQSQPLNVGGIGHITPRIIREGYSIRHIRNGKIVASGGQGGKPFISNIETGSSVTTSESHQSTILEVRFQPESNIFTTCSADKTVKLWNAKTPASPLYEFRHNGTVRSLDFDSSGRILCSSDTHDEPKVWDVSRQVMIRCLKGGGSLVRFQPGSWDFLAVAKQNVITIIDWQALRVVNSLQGHVKDINSICWDVTGKRIASTIEDDVRVWSVFNGGECIHEYPSDGKKFQSVIFHPRYHSILVIGGYQICGLPQPNLWNSLIGSSLLFIYREVLGIARILENKRQRHSLRRASEVSITGLAATMAQSGSIASASNDSVVIEDMEMKL
ncbi:hypothetical protein P8452_32917 [Trifolium repens]|nr:hypothetical protein P8452_32917 [Trifolium repens]